MSTLPLHSSLHIVRTPRPAATRPVASGAGSWWSRAGDYLVSVGERATHHRLGSWTRR